MQLRVFTCRRNFRDTLATRQFREIQFFLYSREICSKKFPEIREILKTHFRGHPDI
jgi:hypothetical protein